jgi:hypothetical protein
MQEHAYACLQIPKNLSKLFSIKKAHQKSDVLFKLPET